MSFHFRVLVNHGAQTGVELYIDIIHEYLVTEMFWENANILNQFQFVILICFEYYPNMLVGA